MGNPEKEFVPWKVGLNGAIVEDRPVDIKDLSYTVTYYGGYFVCESVWGPRANLIAAAPQLLAIARRVRQEMGVEDSDYIDDLEAALAKAEGR